MPVEGNPNEDVVLVTFVAHAASYNPGEVAYFSPEAAQALVDEGVATIGGEPPTGGGDGDSGTPTAAILTGGAQLDPDALLTALQAISDASFGIAINGTLQQMGPIPLDAATSLAMIAAAIGANLDGARCDYATDHFTITTDATGAGASLDFAVPPTFGTDISTMCRLTAATGATIAAAGGREAQV